LAAVVLVQLRLFYEGLAVVIQFSQVSLPQGAVVVVREMALELSLQAVLAVLAVVLVQIPTLQAAQSLQVDKVMLVAVLSIAVKTQVAVVAVVVP
jgi:hypothetical protein